MALKGGTSQDCAACKYQGKKCSSDCRLAPYFPPDQPKMFQNAHKLFGVNNILKILMKLDLPQKEEAMRSIIYQANIRDRFPVHGCWGIICQLRFRIRHVEEELHAVHSHLEMYRHHHQNITALTEDVPSQLELGMAQPQPCLPQQYSHSVSSNIGYGDSYLDSNDNLGNMSLWGQHPYATNNNNNSMPIQSQLVASQPLAIQQEVQDHDEMHPIFDTIDDRQSYIETKEPYESSGTAQGDVLIINSTNIRVQTTIRKAHIGIVTALAFSHDSKALVSASMDSSARVTLVENKSGESSTSSLWIIIFIILLAIATYFLMDS